MVLFVSCECYWGVCQLVEILFFGRLLYRFYLLLGFLFPESIILASAGSNKFGGDIVGFRIWDHECLDIIRNLFQLVDPVILVLPQQNSTVFFIWRILILLWTHVRIGFNVQMVPSFDVLVRNEILNFYGVVVVVIIQSRLKLKVFLTLSSKTLFDPWIRSFIERMIITSSWCWNLFVSAYFGVMHLLSGYVFSSIMFIS